MTNKKGQKTDGDANRHAIKGIQLSVFSWRHNIWKKYSYRTETY